MMKLISTFRRVIANDHDDTLASERVIARTEPHPMGIEAIRRGLAGEP